MTLNPIEAEAPEFEIQREAMNEPRGGILKQAVLGISGLAMSVAAMGAPDRATAEEVQVALNGDEGLVEMIVQETGITRERVKGFMDEDLHAQIDAMPESAFSYLTAILEQVFELENEGQQRFIAGGMIAVFLAPNGSSFERAIFMFGRVGLEVDPQILDTARMYLEAEEYKIKRERGDIIIAMATQDELIARQKEDLLRINSLILEKESILAASQEELAASQEELAASQEKLAASKKELQNMYELRDAILRNIKDIRERGTQKPA